MYEIRQPPTSCVQPLTSSNSLQLPHGHGSHGGRSGHGGRGGRVVHGGRCGQDRTGGLN